MIKQIIAEFDDFVSHRQLKLILSENEEFHYFGDIDLAGILISNLLRNAIIHSPTGTVIEILISKKEIKFENSGKSALDNRKIFSRFRGAENSGSTGLGLAIAKAITEKLHLKLSYHYNSQKHLFTIGIPHS